MKDIPFSDRPSGFPPIFEIHEECMRGVGAEGRYDAVFLAVDIDWIGEGF